MSSTAPVCQVGLKKNIKLVPRDSSKNGQNGNQEKNGNAMNEKSSDRNQNPTTGTKISARLIALDEKKEELKSSQIGAKNVTPRRVIDAPLNISMASEKKPVLNSKLGSVKNKEGTPNSSLLFSGKKFNKNAAVSDNQSNFKMKFN